MEKSSCSYYAALDAVLFIQETLTHVTLLALEREQTLFDYISFERQW